MAVPTKAWDTVSTSFPWIHPLFPPRSLPRHYTRATYLRPDLMDDNTGRAQLTCPQPPHKIHTVGLTFGKRALKITQVLSQCTWSSFGQPNRPITHHLSATRHLSPAKRPPKSLWWPSATCVLKTGPPITGLGDEPARTRRHLMAGEPPA